MEPHHSWKRKEDTTPHDKEFIKQYKNIIEDLLSNLEDTAESLVLTHETYNESKSQLKKPFRKLTKKHDAESSMGLKDFRQHLSYLEEKVMMQKIQLLGIVSDLQVLVDEVEEILD